MSFSNREKGQVAGTAAGAGIGSAAAGATATTKIMKHKIGKERKAMSSTLRESRSIDVARAKKARSAILNNDKGTARKKAIESANKATEEMRLNKAPRKVVRSMANKKFKARLGKVKGKAGMAAAVLGLGGAGIAAAASHRRIKNKQSKNK